MSGRKTASKKRLIKKHAPVVALARKETPSLAENIEKVLIGGDLTPLNPDQRVDYYKAVCKSLGLNPLTRPFDYIVFRENESGPGKLQLYARKDCTEQLRKMYGVGVVSLKREMGEDICLVEAMVKDKFGKPDVGTGVVSLWKYKDGKRMKLDGKELCNAIMKAETKAKRRATLSVCGLGFLDESEIESIEDYNLVTPGGRVMHEMEERGTMEAANVVAQQKLLANASGKPMTEQTKEPLQTELPTVTAKMEERKAAAAASVTDKVLELYPLMVGDQPCVAFVKSAVLALMLDNGGKSFTAFSDRLSVRYMPDDPSYMIQLEGVSKPLGITCKRIPTLSASAGAAEQRTTVSDRTAPQPQTAGNGPQTTPKSEAAHKEKAAASVAQKVVELYPLRIGDLDAVVFVDSPALAFLCDNGLKDFTVWAPNARYRFMSDEQEGIALLVKVAGSLGIEVRRISPPKPSAPATTSPPANAAPRGATPPARTTAAPRATVAQPRAKAEIDDYIPDWDKEKPEPEQPRQAASGDTITGKIEVITPPRGPGKPLWVKIGGVDCSCWHQHIGHAKDLLILDVFTKSIGQIAVLDVTRTEKNGTKYVNIEGIKRIGSRAYDETGPVRTTNDMGQIGLY